jgi:ketosteroid isomerase-like protein
VRALDQETRNAIIDIQQHVADYWHDIDENEALGAESFYTEDCVMLMGPVKRFDGHEGVRAFYADREKRGQRTTRHTCSNFRVILETPTRAQANFVVANYGADGPAPIVGADVPSLVSQVNTICVRQENGSWRIARLEAKPIFISKEPYTHEQLVGEG